MSLHDQFLILYFFAIDFRIEDTHRLLPNISRATILNTYTKLRTKVAEVIETIQMENSVDGKSDVIEIDESLFGKKRKNNKGDPTERIWIFGLVDRMTRKSFFTPVHDRTSQTLLPIIKRRVKRGSMIYHDDWSVYKQLETHGYRHDVVVHTKEFVSATGACTNTIEGIFFIIYYLS